jgi:hypothetical protein
MGTFFKYIIELIVIIYFVRMIMRFLDGTFATKPINKQNFSGNAQPQSNATSAPQPKSQSTPSKDDYIDFEEIK